MELDYHLLLARDVGLVASVQYEALAPRVLTVRQMLGKLISKLESQPT